MEFRDFTPSQVFRRLLKYLFLYSSMPPINSWVEEDIQENKKFSDFNIAYLLIYNQDYFRTDALR